MIVSHLHRFILLKTQKTGGTSVELALSQICGPDDIVTPLTEDDEKLRGSVKAQNYVIPEARRAPSASLLRLLGKRGARAGTEFHEHMNASDVRRAIGPEVFDAYLKVTIVRNPWDREVSRYFWATRGDANPPPFDRWVRKTEFLPMADGRLRRRVTRNDGTIEHDEVIPAGRIHIAAARAGTGLSQSQFAQLLGVSVRTLQDWESGRRNPSGAAQTLLRIASKHPRVVREVAA